MDQIKNLTWHTDDLGPYWRADLYENGKKVGITGSYYNVDEHGRRATKEEQEAEIAAQFEVVA